MSGINPDFKPSAQEFQDPIRQINKIENNVKASFDKVARDAWAKLVPTNLKTAAYTAILEDLVSCNGTFTLTLPTATPQNQGRSVGVILLSGTLSVTAAKCLTQGLTTDTLKAPGLYLYVSDGVGWRRWAGVTTVTGGTGITVTPTSGDITVSLDGSTAVTQAALTAAVQPLRQNMEMIRLLLINLIRLELGQPTESIEGMAA